jgi:ABC-type branched-subunit amino acid transport system substrate-binding protein
VRRRNGPAVLLLLALVGCGSTVPVGTQQAGTTGQAQTGLGVPDGSGGLALGDPSGGAAGSGQPGAAAPALPGAAASALPGAGAPGGPLGGPAGTSGEAGPGASVGAAAPPPPASDGAPARGVTATSVGIGFVYSPNQGEAARQVTGGSADFGDPLAFAKAAVKRVNATGGIGGRQVVLEPYPVDPLDGRTTDSRQQALCSHFTEDRKVFAVMNAGGPIVQACFAKSGTVPVVATFATLGEAEFAADAGYVDVSALTPEAALANLVDSFSRSDYLRTRWDTTRGAPGGVAPVKVGILYPDLQPWRRAVREHLVPGLARQGVRVDPDDVVEWNFAESSSEAADSIATFQAAVLKWRSSGVTHVIPVENNGTLVLQFAESQNYRPRYAITSANQVQGYVGAGAVPEAQLTGMTGVGWQPSYDLADPKGFEPPGRAECLKIMREGGAQVPADNNAILSALTTCDQFLLLQRAVAVNGDAVLSRAAVRSGLERIGSSFAFAGIPSGTYRADKRYPVDKGWLWGWDTGCRCLRYSSDAFPLRRP